MLTSTSLCSGEPVVDHSVIIELEEELQVVEAEEEGAHIALVDYFIKGYVDVFYERQEAFSLEPEILCTMQVAGILIVDRSCVQVQIVKLERK